MHRIRVFLASSITEFSQERMLLGDFVRMLNDILVERDVYIQLGKSEDITNAIDLFRKQNQYNEVIRKSDYFFMLIGKAVGAYTMEEYETACGSDKKGMRILFRERPETECGQSRPAESDALKQPEGLPDAGAAMTPDAFRSRLEKEKRMYMDFSSADSIKLALLMMLSAEEDIAGYLFFRDGQAWLDGREALSLMETPIYQNDEALREMVLRKRKLEREYIECLRERGSKAGEEAQRLLEEIRQLEQPLALQENSMLKLFRYINKQKASGDRERAAQRYLAQGDLAAAAEILRDPLRQSEREAAEEGILRLREHVKAQIRRNREEVFALLGGDIPEKLPDEAAPYIYLAEMLFKENCRLAKEYLVEFEALGDYARWQLSRGRHEEASKLTEKMELYRDLYSSRAE